MHINDQKLIPGKLIVINEFNRFNEFNSGENKIATHNAFRTGYWNVFYATKELISFLDNNKIAYALKTRKEVEN